MPTTSLTPLGNTKVRQGLPVLGPAGPVGAPTSGVGVGAHSDCALAMSARALACLLCRGMMPL